MTDVGADSFPALCRAQTLNTALLTSRSEPIVPDINPLEPPFQDCRVCGASLDDGVRVLGNTRAVEGMSFTVAQCPGCGSINAVEPVDLSALYRDYPLHASATGFAAWGFERAFAARARRLPSAGVHAGARVLDFGGGRGGFSALLRRRGYDAEAWDPAFDTEPPDRSFDAITCQDVIEHVDEPAVLLGQIAELLAPGGLMLLGAPLADGINLADAERWIMHLHQPYHRCIPSEDAIRRLADSAGLQMIQFERCFAGQSALPGVNARFVEAYGQACGGLLEHAISAPNPLAFLKRPSLVADALFGALAPCPSNFAAILQRP